MAHPIDRLSGNSTTESNPTFRPTFRERRDYDLPVDIPPEKVQAVLRADIENRLRDVCGNWSTGEFDRVVADVTATAMKFHTPKENRQIPDAAGVETTVVPTTSETAGLLRSAIDSVQQVLKLEIGLPRTR